MGTHDQARDSHAQATAKHESDKRELISKFENLITNKSYTFPMKVSTKQNGKGLENDVASKVTHCLVFKTGNSSNRTHFKAISGVTKYTIEDKRLKLTKGTWCNKAGNDRWLYTSGTLWLTPHNNDDRLRLLKLFAEAGIQPGNDATGEKIQKLFQPQDKTSGAT